MSSIWDKPFKRMLVLGESHVAGQSATKPAYQWVNRVASYIEMFQHEPVHLINKGIGATSIAPNSPGLYASMTFSRDGAIMNYASYWLGHEHW